MGKIALGFYCVVVGVIVYVAGLSSIEEGVAELQAKAKAKKDAEAAVAA